LSLPTHHTRFAILGLALLVVFQVAAPRQGRAGASGPHGRHVAKGADRSEPAASTSAPIPAPRDSASAPDSGDSAAIPDSGGQVHDPQEDVHPPLESVARGLGLENVTVDRSGPQERIAYENRRFRHSADAYGWLARGGESFVGYERRLGMVAASIERDPAGPAPFRVRYPTDANFNAPRGKVQDPTSHTLDLTVGPLIAYELGRLATPVQFQIQSEATLRWNPWPGSRLTGSVVFPMYNDFQFSSLHPDVDNVRPGLVTFEQYAWLPRVALTSASLGVFADNRYGFSLGAARPLRQGSLLLDAQTDLTGFLAFETDGISYSSSTDWSMSGAISYRPPWMDASVRARVAQYLYGDHGADVEIKRSFGDLDLAMSILHSKDLTVESVRVTLPVPPLTRPARMPLRLLPVERLPLSYRSDATPVGVTLVGPASREDFLRQLSSPALAANRYRYRRAQGLSPQRPSSDPVLWANHSGMTGFVITPWAGVQPEGQVELGFTNIPKKWSYNPMRGVYHNEIYYASLGLLPHTEVGLRITRTPGFNPLADPDSHISTDTDHMVSVRVALVEPRENRPGVAVGVDDIQGTRRYHSSYLVSGVPFSIFHVQNRFSLGYASPVFMASRHVLDGPFGAVEVSPWRAVATRIEYDTEKFNVGLGVDLGFGLRIRAAALNMESLSAGVGWHHKL